MPGQTTLYMAIQLYIYVPGQTMLYTRYTHNAMHGIHVYARPGHTIYL